MKLRLAGPEAHAALAAALQPAHRATHQQENFFFDGASQELSSQRVVLRMRFYNKDAKALITVKVGGGPGRGVQFWPQGRRMCMWGCFPCRARRLERCCTPCCRAAAVPLLHAAPCRSMRRSMPACLAFLFRLQGKQVLKDGIGRAPEEEETVDPAAARAFLTDPDRLLNLGTPLLEGLKRRGQLGLARCRVMGWATGDSGCSPASHPPFPAAKPGPQLCHPQPPRLPRL